MAAFSGSMMKFWNSLAFSTFLASFRTDTLSMKIGYPSLGYPKTSFGFWRRARNDQPFQLTPAARSSFEYFSGLAYSIEIQLGLAATSLSRTFFRTSLS